jgi:hypothetical protein
MYVLARRILDRGVHDATGSEASKHGAEGWECNVCVFHWCIVV